MTSWDEDRKFVLEALKDNKEEHKAIMLLLRSMQENHWKLNAKVAGVAGGMGILGGALAAFLLR